MWFKLCFVIFSFMLVGVFLVYVDRMFNCTFLSCNSEVLFRFLWFWSFITFFWFWSFISFFSRKHGHKIKKIIVSLELPHETKNEIIPQNQNKIKNDKRESVGDWSKHLQYLIDKYNKIKMMVAWITIKICRAMIRTKWSYTPKKLLTPLSTTTQKTPPKVINLPNRVLTKHEIEVLKLRLFFSPAPKHNISEIETDIYNFIRKLCLTYHFCDSTYDDKLIVKNASTFTSNINENQELESISKNLSESEINIKTTSDNIPNLRDWLDSLITKIRSNLQIRDL